MENRARLILEVTATWCRKSAARARVCRISPVSPTNSISCSGPQTQYEYIIDRLDVLGITCIHVVEGATSRPREVAPFEYGSLRRRFSRTYIAVTSTLQRRIWPMARQI